MTKIVSYDKLQQKIVQNHIVLTQLWTHQVLSPLTILYSVSMSAYM